MNKASIIPLSVVLTTIAGCASGLGPRPDAAVDAEIVCRDRTVRLRHVAGFLAANPEYIEICREQVLTVQIVPPAGMGRARTAGGMGSSGAAAAWLNQSGNTAGNRILITVPEMAALDEYKYSITVDGVGTLDPRLRVVR